MRAKTLNRIPYFGAAMRILFSVGLSLLGARLQAADFTVEVGPQETIIPNGAFDFHYFPDEPVCIIGTNPFRYLMVVADKTVLMQGNSLASASPVGVVLRPGEDYDKQYAGISSVFIANGSILGFYHGEKPLGGTDEQGTRRFNGVIALAVSNNGGTSFWKAGQILTSHKKEDPKLQKVAQGVGDASVCLDHSGKWLFAYYTEHSAIDPATNKSRGHIVCMARSKIEEGGKPGSWKKYYKGSFEEPGLGGKDTEVAPCWAPNVAYIPAIKKYVMLGSASGTVMFLSDDGIKWQNKTMLFAIKDVPDIGNAIAMHPAIVVASATPKGFSGEILYSFSHAYGHAPPLTPHYFVGRSITFKFKKEKKTPQNPPKKKGKTAPKKKNLPKRRH